MNKAKETDKKERIDKILVSASLLVITFIILYIIYAITLQNKAININELVNLSIKQEDNTNMIKNTITDETSVKAERIYEEIEISNYTSTLYDNEQNRIYNINKACEIINGTTIKPKDTFSFNEIVGPMDEAHGFKKATGFDSNGKLIQISGGGMCQISSTIYNAVLLADLEVVERHPHSRRVNYVPADKDATILYPTLDFKFKNNTEQNIKIYCSTDNYSVYVKLIKTEQPT